jgi:hypothetical protein
MHINKAGWEHTLKEKPKLREKAEDKTLNKESTKLQGASGLPTTENEKEMLGHISTEDLRNLQH